MKLITNFHPKGFLSLFAIVAAQVVALMFATTASAQITFDLNNVTLDVNGVAAGTLSGTFTTNSSTLSSSSSLTSWSFTATPTTFATNPSLGHQFTGFTYTQSNSTIYYDINPNGLLSGFDLDSPASTTNQNNSDNLRLSFASNLSATGTVSVLTTNSYESEHASGGVRDVATGTVSAAPEPVSWALGVVAMLALVVLRWRANVRTVPAVPLVVR